MTTLQRSLLFHDLQTLSSSEWEAAFTSVLFPMLSHLLVKSKPGERTAMEETRTRAATLLGKVFLQHLTPLATLQTFTALWLTILDFMEKFIKAATSDLLADQIPESLKNMLLVMDTAGIFISSQSISNDKTTPLWELTWDKLDTFLPNLMPDLFGDRQRADKQSVAPVAIPVSPSYTNMTTEMKVTETSDNQTVIPIKTESSIDQAADGTVISKTQPDNLEQSSDKNTQPSDSTNQATIEDQKPSQPDLPAPEVEYEAKELEEMEPNPSADSDTVLEAIPITADETINVDRISMQIETDEGNKNNLEGTSIAPQEKIETTSNAPFVLASSTLMKPDSSIPQPPIISPIEPPFRSASNFFPISPETIISEQVTSNSMETMSETIIGSGSNSNAPAVVNIPQPTILNLPSRPNIAPMPPPPPGIMNTRTFQPIHPNVALTESPNTQPITLVSPKPLHLPPPNQLPTPSINPQLASYFGAPALSSYGSGDIHSGIVGSFTSTPITSMPYPHPSNLSANIKETVTEKSDQPESCDDKPQGGQMHNV